MPDLTERLVQAAELADEKAEWIDRWPAVTAGVLRELATAISEDPHGLPVISAGELEEIADKIEAGGVS